MTNYLEQYVFPQDLRRLSKTELKRVAEEIRKLILHTVAANGGHLAPSLGAVELAIALHIVLETPRDKIVWDVGHQAYAHKILTGRLGQLDTLRKYKGISGFPKREESEYDTFTVGHASTSVSAAVGMARARDIKGEDHAVVAVIGDGSFSGGMVFEALNNSQGLKNFVVVLNDNGMSISNPVGLMSKLITELRMSTLYTALKKNTERFLNTIPKIGRPLHNTIDRWVGRTGNIIIQELARKQHAGFFHDLGVTYLGPIDGHNIPLLTAALKYAKGHGSPMLVHVITKKGKGYKPAEDNPAIFHGVPCIEDMESGLIQKCTTGKSYTALFSEELMVQSVKNQKICAVTAAMCSGTGLAAFAKEHPSRFFDVGIAEEHAVTFSGALATQGLKPVLALYSTFLQRGYDQVIHDVALQKAGVFFAIDRAGLVGDDGPTHHGVFDLSFLRAVPGLIIAAPKDGNELKDMVATGLALESSFALRYPRGTACFFEPARDGQLLPIGQGEIVYGKPGAKQVIWAIGAMVSVAMQVAEEIKDNICVVNARFVKPLDMTLLRLTAAGAARIITLEDNAVIGGFGSAVVEALQELRMQVPVVIRGVPDHFVEQGSRDQLYVDCGLDQTSLVQLIRQA